MTMEVANTILAQLGGGQFVAMTGSKIFVGSDRALTFKLPARFAKDGITAVRVTLEPSDTYTMEFMKVRGSKVTTIAKVEDVYADMLREVFTAKTGLETSLGTMGRTA